jgi:hypothetical protein
VKTCYKQEKIQRKDHVFNAIAAILKSKLPKHGDEVKHVTRASFVKEGLVTFQNGCDTL